MLPGAIWPIQVPMLSLLLKLFALTNNLEEHSVHQLLRKNANDEQK